MEGVEFVVDSALVFGRVLYADRVLVVGCPLNDLDILLPILGTRAALAVAIAADEPLHIERLLVIERVPQVIVLLRAQTLALRHNALPRGRTAHLIGHDGQCLRSLIELLLPLGAWTLGARRSHSGWQLRLGVLVGASLYAMW